MGKYTISTERLSVILTVQTTRTTAVRHPRQNLVAITGQLLPAVAAEAGLTYPV